MKKRFFFSLLILSLTAFINIGIRGPIYAQGKEILELEEKGSSDNSLINDTKQFEFSQTNNINSHRDIVLDRAETLKQKLDKKLSKLMSSNTLDQVYKLKLNSLVNESKGNLNLLIENANLTTSSERLSTLNKDYYSTINSYKEKSLQIQEELVSDEAELCRTKLHLITESINSSITALEKLSIKDCDKEIQEFKEVMAILSLQKNILNETITEGNMEETKEEMINTRNLVGKSKTKLILAKENCKMKLVMGSSGNN